MVSSMGTETGDEYPPPLLVSANIRLEPIALQHAPQLLALVEKDRQLLRQWLPWVEAIQGIKDQEKYILYYQRKYRREKALTCAIFVAGRLAGVISMNSVDWQRRLATIGYWLGKEFQGKGTMFFSTQALISHIFNSLHLNKVVILCATGNTASQQIPRKLRFQQEGCIRKGEYLLDRYVDLYIYGLLRRDA
jgi:ribosomal-protein-serine acetyltransferase